MIAPNIINDNYSKTSFTDYQQQFQPQKETELFDVSDILKKAYSGLETVGNGITSAFSNPYQEQTKSILAGMQDGSIPSPIGLQKMKALDLASNINNANSFDFGGAFDIGLSAFNAFNQYNYQKDAMNMYKKQIQTQNDEIARQNAVRSSWANYK